MPGKNVALRREAVDLLDREKRHGESYSDVVMRLGRQPLSLAELADALEALGPVEDDELDRRLAHARRQSRREPPRRANL